MYSNLTLYYLNQLGIIPWVSKAKAVYKLILLVPVEISPKARSLLKKVVQYTNISPEEVFTMHCDAKQLSAKEELLVCSYRQEGTLVLSFNIKTEMEDVLYCPEVNELLTKPVTKKIIFNLLNQVQNENKRIYST